MTEKCNKYQPLFIFASEDDLLEHIKVCPECRKEHEQMENVASLVKEVKPYLKSKPLKFKVPSQIAACFIVAILCFFALTNYSYYIASKNDNAEALAMIKQDSISTQMGMPTDEYGLINTEDVNDQS